MAENEMLNADISQVISSIIEAESKAEEIVSASLNESKRIISDAGIKAAKIKEEAEIAVKNEITEALNNAGYVADSQCEIIKQDTVKEKEKLKALSDANKLKAIEYITSFVGENL